MNEITKEQKIRAVAKAFMADDPDEYEGESIEDVVLQLSKTSDAFIDHAYEEWILRDLQ